MHCYLRISQGSSITENNSEISDEIFSGWAIRPLGEPDRNGWVLVETHYGYQGFIRTREIRWISKEELQDRQKKQKFRLIGVPEADLLDRPKVQGLPLELLLKNSIVEDLGAAGPEGWSRIRTAAGREGYIRTKYLRQRAEDDGYLLTVPKEIDRSADEKLTYFCDRFRKACVDEETFRAAVVNSAMAYLGTQYRWGGKASQGLDCSGLAFMSYLENGAFIYRDAQIRPEYPVQKIDRSRIRPGDLLFFPGHVAIYMGNDRYIHSTAYAGSPGVTINSLNPQDPDYRKDLDEKMTECGTVFFIK